jgi:hypothetical protein
VIGFGRDVSRFRIGDTRVVLKLVPLTGFVEPVPTNLRAPRLKNACIYSAGPGIELLLAAAIIWGMDRAPFFATPDGLGVLLAQSVVVAVGIGAFTNLLPFSSSGGAPSDGLGILMSPTIPDQVFEDRRATPWLDDARRLIESGDAPAAERILADGLTTLPGDVPLRVEQAVCLAAMQRRDDAVDALNELGDPHDHPLPRRVLLLHARGRIALEISDEPALSRDGLLACEAALELAPGYGAVEVTLGSLLVERNRADEAISLLARARERVREALDESRAVAYLAIASHRVGQREAAELDLAELRELAASPRMLRRVTAEMGS